VLIDKRNKRAYSRSQEQGRLDMDTAAQILGYAVAVLVLVLIGSLWEDE
jgi:hypothetical protein